MSCNFLTPRAIDAKNSDTLSEISESGTTTSGLNSNWDANEDMKEFINKIGLKDVSDLYQERFKVDRKKLEQMLSGDNGALIPADVFFAKVMEATDTYITWPSKLKIGAKSKKDPHVRIAGRNEDVALAKERVMAILNPRCNRVTMKMDVSYTDHSHIIGRGGLTIKRVMEETRCHVHFPDSNRNNPTEKSNQVSISGDIEGVEFARSRVRELTPLIFGFELPVMSQHVDSNSSYIQKIQGQYSVQVIFRTRPKLHATLVLVKGVEWEVQQVKQATLLLVEYMCESLANQTPIQMSMEISPHHHHAVLGKNHSNLKAIMQYTGCRIMFSDALDPNIPSLKKSNVIISGNIHNVYKARQLLTGSLPLLIIFDLPEDSANLKVNPTEVDEIQRSCDVTINIRSKSKQNTMVCVITGVEKLAVNIYKARNMILGIDEPPISADIPMSYQLPNTYNNQTGSSSVLDSLPLSASGANLPSPHVLSPLVSPSFQLPAPPGLSQCSRFVGMTHQPQFVFNVMQQSMASSGYHSLGQLSNSSISLEQTKDSCSYSTMSSGSSISSPLPSPRKATSPNYFRNFDAEKNDAAAVTEVSYPQSIEGKRHNLTPSDYESKRLAGLKAMQHRPTPGSFRVPVNSWCGYGISYTSPANPSPSASTSFFSDGDQVKTRKEEDIWKTKPEEIRGSVMPTSTTASPLNSSNILDNTPTYYLGKMTNSSNWPDLPSLLNSLGLDRYMNLFSSHEIDLGIFTTLREPDLIEIGINALGARRRMLIAIAELNRRSNPFSAAPGSERKSSSSSHHSSTYNSPRETW